MKKTLTLSLVLYFLICISIPCFALLSNFLSVGDYAHLESFTNNGSDYKTFFQGAFVNPISVQPNKALFKITSIHQTLSKQLMSGEIGISDEYIFMGRTGENNFEIQHVYRSIFNRIDSKEEKMNIYFVKDDLLELRFAVPYTGCNELTVKLKMLALDGNNLKYQILLSDCLRKSFKIPKSDKMPDLIKNLPLSKAIKIGNGENIVVEFTDPDCKFCRKMSEYFKTRSDTTRYVFLFPMTFHPKAREKSLYILCSDDRVKTLEEVMSGKVDNSVFQVCNNPEMNQLIEEYKNVGTEIGVTGTPTYFINGKIVRGAKTDQIESIFKEGR